MSHAKKGGRPPMPKAPMPSVLTMDVNALTEELQSAEAKVANETASIGTASKKKNKRSAYTAAAESSPALLQIPSPRPPSITPSPRPPSARLSTTDVSEAVQDQINAAAELARINATSSGTLVQEQIDATEMAVANATNSETSSVQDQIDTAAELTLANTTNSGTSAQDQILVAIEIARADANSASPEMDEEEAVVAGGNFLEDAFGGMTLDEDVVNEPKEAMMDYSRPGSFDAMSFQPIETPQQQQQQQYSNSGDNYSSPLDGRIGAGQTSTSLLRSSINATKMNGVKLAPLDTPSKFDANAGVGAAPHRDSFEKHASGAGQPGEVEEAEGNKKDDVRMRVGYYQIDKKHNVRYVFIPKAMLRNPQFDFDEAFAALNITVPDLIFDLNSAPDVDEWNLRLPDEYKHLQTKEMYNPEDKSHGISRMLLHYQGVVRENCRRLLRASTAACSQAGAVFRTKATWDMNRDVVAEWASDSGEVDLLLVAGAKSFYKEFQVEMMKPGKSKLFSPQIAEAFEETEELIANRIRIKTHPWVHGHKKPVINANGDYTEGIPHPCGTHLLISEDLKLLEKKLEARVPTGYIIINGKTSTTQSFCNAIHGGKPIFIFRHTGDSADLICEALKEAREFAKQRHTNPKARAKRPFEINMPPQYCAERYIWRFDDNIIASCQMLNILLDNFPYSFNPLSVLDIDMFTMTEEKLQDSLTKTMSVAFEGMVEMGGQALEAKRLTYAWRMHHLFEANATRLKSFATTLEIMVIIMTLASTLASVGYSYLLSDGPNFGVVLDQRSSGITMMASNYGLVALNLFLPLAISVLRAMGAAMTPYSKYTALRIATVKIQSEIYTYRTKTGKYNSRKVIKKDKKKDDKGGDGGSNKKGEDDFKPSKMLGNAMDGVWADLLASDITKGALIAPQMFYDPMDSTNLVIQSNIRLQKMLTENLKPPAKNVLLEGAGALAGVGGFFYRYMAKQAMKVERARKRAEQMAWAATQLKKQKEEAKVYADDEEGASPNHKRRTLEDMEAGDSKVEGRVGGNNKGGSLDGGNSQLLMDSMLMEEEEVVVEEPKKKKVDTTAYKPVYDNGLDMLSADEYIRIRLVPSLALFMSETPNLSRLSQVVKGIVILLSVFSSILSTIDLIVLIPAFMAISGAATAWVAYMQTDLTILAKNNAISQMNKLIVWWDSLSMIEKRSGGNKEMLVLTTELAIQSQVLGYTNSESSSSSDDKEEKEEKDK